MPEIIYEKDPCPICDTHKTDLGLLKSLEESARVNFQDWPSDKKRDLIIAWFEQTKTDARMHYIEKSKQKTTQAIQQYKQKNIAAMRQ